MATTLTAGSFGAGTREVRIEASKGEQFREKVGILAERLGLSEEQFDQEIKLLIQLRKIAWLRKGIVSTEPCE